MSKLDPQGAGTPCIMVNIQSLTLTQKGLHQSGEEQVAVAKGRAVGGDHQEALR